MKKVLIVTGGTGGHIFPAIALADKISKNHKTIILGDKKTKQYVVNKHNFKASTVYSSQITAGKLSKIKVLLKISIGVIQSMVAITYYRPNVVFAFGGYATFPTLIAATLLRRKIILHEQNSHLGKVNRIFAKYCYKIATTFEETTGISKKFTSKITHTGTIIRQEILELLDAEYTLPKEIPKTKRKNMGYEGLILASEFDQIAEPIVPREMLNILIVGGSGGAELFSKILPKAFFNLSEEFKNSIQIFQQSRPDLTQLTFQNYEEFNMNIEIDSFFEDMKSMIEKAHLVISRAGSTSIHEFLVAKKPMILVPFAKSADDHQLKNAKIFEKNNCAILIEEKDFTIKNISNIINDILSKDKKLLKMSANCKKYTEKTLSGATNLLNLINE